MHARFSPTVLILELEHKPANLALQDCHAHGWGTRIRTWDERTRTACLTTWLYPKNK